MTKAITYRIFPLGDNALTVDYGNHIDEKTNKEILRRFEYLKQNPVAGMIEAVPAYSSLTIYYDVVALRKTMPAGLTVFNQVKEEVISMMDKEVNVDLPSVTQTVPVCYDEMFAPDMASLALHKKISPEEVIAIHTSRTYRIYMLGFIPGFTYMGLVDDRLVMPRKTHPVPVAQGSIGIAGKQTGIYPFASQGGWHIIGRTPLGLFDAKQENPVLLKAGDIVQFVSISKHEFANY
jgi:inhibitor of KinA